MSYKNDMDFYNADFQARKNTVFNIIKITAVVFAAVAVMLSVFLAIDIAGGAGWGEPSGNVGGGASGEDTVAPVIKGPDGNILYVALGETVSYKNVVSVVDESEYTLEVTKNNVNTDKEGEYSVTYVAKDSEGNTSKPFTLKVVVTKSEYTYSMLMDVVEKLIPKLGITPSMQTPQKVRKIYEYVNDPTCTVGDNARIRFTDESNIPNIDRAKWQSDWVEEAYRTLKPLADGSKKTVGDCYSYYAASKAFFEYYEIENKGIKRDESGSNMEGTHFWLMVNVGSASNPSWYYYDATRLAGSFSDSKQCCLRTLAELETYTPSKSGQYGFYSFDKTGLPTASTKKLDLNK